MVLLVELVKEHLKAFRKETFFSLVNINVLHHVDKNALCSMRVLKFGWTSTSKNLTASTAVIKLSAFTDVFVKQSAKQFWVEMWARSWILPEQVSFRNMEIMWIVSFCSGKWIVLAVVTRFFASVLMWTSGTSPDMSIHSPRRNWHETKHFTNKHNSATVVETTVLVIIWLSWSTILPYETPSSEECSRISGKILSCLSVKTHLHCYIRSIKKSNYSQRSCEWPELKFHWLRLELSCQLDKKLHITNCWKSSKHIWKTCSNTGSASYSAKPIHLSEKASVPGMQCWSAVEIFFWFLSTWISSTSFQ